MAPNLPYSPGLLSFCSTATSGWDIFKDQSITIQDTSTEEWTSYKFGFPVTYRERGSFTAQGYTSVITFRPYNSGLSKGTNVKNLTLTTNLRTYTIPVYITLGGSCDGTVQNPGSEPDAPQPVLKVNRSRLSFSARLGGTNPSASLQIESTGGVLKWNATTDQPGWVILAPGKGATDTNPQLSVTVNLDYFKSRNITGQQSAQVTIADQNNRVLTVDVIANIDAASVSAPPASNQSCNDQGTVRLTALEVTQGIQNLNNEMPLVSGRFTFVRAHVRSNTGNPVENFSARLFNPNATGVKEVVSGLGTIVPSHITVKTNPSRAELSDSLFFELPPEWVAGNSLTLQIRPNSGGTIECDEVLSDKDSIKDGAIALPLITVPAVPVQFYKGSHPTGTATDAQVAMIRKAMLDYMPTAALQDVGAVQMLSMDAKMSVSYSAPLFERLNELRANAKVFHVAVFPGFGGGVAQSGGYDFVHYEKDFWTIPHEIEHAFNMPGKSYGIPHVDSGGSGEKGYNDVPDYVHAGQISEHTDAADPRTYYAIRKFYDVCPFVDAPASICENYNKDKIVILPPDSPDPLYRGIPRNYAYPSAWAYKLMMNRIIAGKFDTVAQVKTDSAEIPATLVSGILTGPTSGQVTGTEALLVKSFTPNPTGIMRCVLKQRMVR